MQRVKQGITKDYRLLIKLPTRGRPKQFVSVMQSYINLSACKDNVYIVSLDLDDNSMIDPPVLPGVFYKYGTSKSKIEAINRDIPPSGWDIMLLTSDDMMPLTQGWDLKIKKYFANNFKDTDGILWLFDGNQKRLNTLPVIGYQYYIEQGYIYHHSYFGNWCDNEMHDIAQSLGRQVFVPENIIRHQHPAFVKKVKRDSLYNKNDRYFEQDKQNYLNRKKNGFH